ncbi:MAG: phosphotransferase-like protein [Acidimicrobiales bacterium]
MPTDVIVLNGGSSSGKTSIAHRLLEVLPGTWLTLGVDDLFDALGERAGDDAFIAFGADGGVVAREGFRRAEAAWSAGVAAMARSGVGVVVDDVFLGGASSQAYLRAALSGLDVLWVGVRCPAMVAAQREAGRAERIGGMAASQADLVHDGVSYDIEVDTATTSATRCAEAIAALVDLGPSVDTGRPVIIDYDPSWPTRAATLVETLGGRLSPLARRVEHIGSTAIFGMAAKDVIDLQVSVDDLEGSTAAFDVPLRALGFQRSAITTDHVPAGVPAGEPLRWEKRLWTRRVHPAGDVNLQVRRVGSPNERLALLFRDWFRVHRAAVPAYGGFKRSLAAVAVDAATYSAMKDPMVDLVISAAEEWAIATGWRPCSRPPLPSNAST